MKTKFRILVAFTMLFTCAILSSGIFSQESPRSIIIDKNESAGFRSDIYNCPDESVYGVVSQVIETGYFCQAGYAYTIVAVPYSASGTFQHLRLWGIDFLGCTMLTNEDFEVFIWDADPSAGGKLIFNQVLSANLTDLQVFNAVSNTYQIDIALNTLVSQLDGWIGVKRLNPSCDMAFAWLAFNAGTGGPSLQFNDVDQAWEDAGSDFLICLSNQIPPVPLSNWALYLGILLMVTFVVIRFRRMI